MPLHYLPNLARLARMYTVSVLLALKVLNDLGKVTYTLHYHMVIFGDIW